MEEELALDEDFELAFDEDEDEDALLDSDVIDAVELVLADTWECCPALFDLEPAGAPEQPNRTKLPMRTANAIKQMRRVK